MENKHIAFVNKQSVQTLADSDILKSFDLVVAKDSDIIYYLDDDKKLIPIRPEVMIFKSKSNAIEQINKSSNRSSMQIGQTVIIKNDNDDKYGMYIIIEDTSITGRLTVEQVSGSGGTGGSGSGCNMIECTEKEISDITGQNDFFFPSESDFKNLTSKFKPYTEDDIKSVSKDNDLYGPAADDGFNSIMDATLKPYTEDDIRSISNDNDDFGPADSSGAGVVFDLSLKPYIDDDIKSVTSKDDSYTATSTNKLDSSNAIKVQAINNNKKSITVDDDKKDSDIDNKTYKPYTEDDIKAILDDNDFI